MSGSLAATAIFGLLAALPGRADAQLARELGLLPPDSAAVRGAVLPTDGHVFPVWFGFRGGKGGATAGGLLCYLAPTAAFAVIGAWLLLVLTTGFVGLATISAALVAVAYLGVTALPERHGLFAFACVTAALLIYAHRGNIGRMLNGTESRFARPAWGRLFRGK
jgi:glycerol-3-phosphate acyltransferase PlsY